MIKKDEDYACDGKRKWMYKNKLNINNNNNHNERKRKMKWIYECCYSFTRITFIDCPEINVHLHSESDENIEKKTLRFYN